jgi:hypothetical protein
MNRLSVVFAILTVFGCATTNDISDRYTLAANSWKGTSIEEMVAAWSTPNAGFLPAEGEQNGIAGWNVFYESGIDSSMGQGKRTYYRCTTFAHFNSNGTIVRIEVRNSRFCDRRFENQFEAMTHDDVVSRLGASPT